MTRRSKAKKDENGRWAPNGARAKAGLNRVILSSAWGQVVQYTEYKALRAGKLVVKVPFAYSSQECAACGFIAVGQGDSVLLGRGGIVCSLHITKYLV